MSLRILVQFLYHYYFWYNFYVMTYLDSRDIIKCSVQFLYQILEWYDFYVMTINEI